MCHIGDIAEISFCGGETVVFAEKDQFSISVFTGMAQVPVFSEFEIIKNRQCCIIADRHIAAGKINSRLLHIIFLKFLVVAVSGITGNKEIALHRKRLVICNNDLHIIHIFRCRVTLFFGMTADDQFHAVGILRFTVNIPPINGDGLIDVKILFQVHIGDTICKSNSPAVLFHISDGRTQGVGEGVEVIRADYHGTGFRQIQRIGTGIECFKSLHTAHTVQCHLINRTAGQTVGFSIRRIKIVCTRSADLFPDFVISIAVIQIIVCTIQFSGQSSAGCRCGIYIQLICHIGEISQLRIIADK